MSDIVLLPSDVTFYFDGILKNIGDTDYFIYASDSHFYLVYDVNIENGEFVPGNYPVIDLFADSDNYSVTYSSIDVSSVPGAAYGSFGLYSDLRSGWSHTSSYFIFFAIGFAIVYSVLSRFFDIVMYLKEKR